MEDPSTASQLCAMSRELLFLGFLDCSFALFAEEAAAAPLGASCNGADALPIGGAEVVAGVDMISLSIQWNITRFAFSPNHFSS